MHIKKFQKQSKVPISMKHAVAFLENPFIKRNDMGIFHGYVCLPEGYIYGSSNVKCHVILAILPSFENNSRFSSTLKNRTWPAHELSKSRCIAHCKWVFILFPKVKTETSTQKFTYFLQHELDATCSNDPRSTGHNPFTRRTVGSCSSCARYGTWLAMASGKSMWQNQLYILNNLSKI